MAVHLQLDKKNLVYTNCDVISGKAILSIQRQEAFSAITVKLECESRTKLAAPSQGRRDYDVELECHKVCIAPCATYWFSSFTASVPNSPCLSNARSAADERAKR